MVQGMAGIVGTRGNPYYQEDRHKATWQREFKLPWRKAGLLESSQMIKWIQTIKLSVNNCLSTLWQGLAGIVGTKAPLGPP